MLEVSAVEDQEPVETLSANGADEALGDRVRLRRAHRCFDDLDAFACEDGIEVARVLAVSVAIRNRDRQARSCSVQVNWRACCVTHAPGRVRSAASDMHAAATQLDEEDNVQPLQRDGLDGEEVDAEDALRLSSQERAPGQAETLTRRTDPCFAQDLPNGGRRHSWAEPVDLTDDPLIAPARVLAREPKNEVADLATD